jgi:hypothetical protein
MLGNIYKEIYTFFNNAVQLKNKTLLIIILSLLTVPIFFIQKIKDFFSENVNIGLRFVMTYLLSIYQLVVIYNSSIINIDNFRDQNIVINEIRRNNNPVGPGDVLRRIADQIGIDLNNLIDIEIIQIEPEIINNDVNNNDNQNVHDTSVQSHITNCINKLKEDPWREKLKLTNTELINEIKKYIFNEYVGSEEKKEKALNTLNKMKKINGQISKLNMTEVDVLKIVWNRINNPINNVNIKNLKENLVLELADSMIDDDQIYCVMGRTSRIIQTLECCDAENILNIKPIWIIKEEISTLFGKYRNKLFNSLSEKNKNIYNKTEGITLKEKKLIDNINNDIKTIINNKLIKKYIDTNILTKQQYFTITDPYFMALV